MMLVKMFLESLGFKPKNKFTAVAAVVVPVALLVSTFIFIEYALVISIYFIILLPLCLWAYSLTNTFFNGIAKLYQDYKDKQAYEVSVAVPAGAAKRGKGTVATA